jgi:hypothetical protein
MKFSSFVLHELGSHAEPGRFWRNLFLRPFCAPSFHEFWQEWNPAYRYILWYGVYRPVRRVLPASLATMVTFLVSGFVLHDLPFNGGWRWFCGEHPLPTITLLFAIFGALTLVSRWTGMDLSGRPVAVRVLAIVMGLTISLGVLALGSWFESQV